MKDGQWFQCRKSIPRRTWVSISRFFKDERRDYQFKPLYRIEPPIPCDDLVTQDYDVSR